MQKCSFDHASMNNITQTYFKEYIMISSNKIAEYEKIMPQELAKQSVYNISHRIPGFLDLTPREQKVFHEMKHALQKVYEKHGFCPFDVPLFVNRKHIVAKGGIDKQIYSVNLQKSNRMTNWSLAFDRTVPFALWVKGHNESLVLPYKRYDINISYRAEKHTTGRLNGFYQADVDIVDTKLSVGADVECIMTLIEGLRKLNVPEFRMVINDVRIPKMLIKEAGLESKEEDVLRILDRLDKEPPKDIIASIIQLDPSFEREKVEALVKICTYKGSWEEFTHKEHLQKANPKLFEDVKILFDSVREAGKDLFEFSPGTVRGLDYYTGTVFETFFKDVKYGDKSIASGGRYDGLVDVFSRTKLNINGVGGSIGLSRLFHSLREIAFIKEGLSQVLAKFVILIRNKSCYPTAMKIATKMRDMFEVDVYSGSKTKLMHQLGYAHKAGFPFCVIVLDKDIFQVKNLTNRTHTADMSSIDKVLSISRKLYDNLNMKLDKHEETKRFKQSA